MSKKEETTSVQTVDIDLDEILGTGADVVMTPGEGKVAEKKPHVFSPMSTDTTFLDKPIEKPIDKVEKTPEEIAAEAAAKAEADKGKTSEEIEADRLKAEAEAAVGTEKIEDILAPDAPVDDFDDDKNRGGRPSALVTAAKKLIEKGTLLPFDGDDEKKIEDYTAEDFQELIEANFENQQSKTGEQIANQFFESLPGEMQQAYTYIANGGTDIKGMFNALAASTEVKELDITQEAGQKHAIRAYLNAVNFGTPDEIEDEIYTLEDRGDLAKKANQFKPKLDAMQQDIVNNRIAKQEQDAKARQVQSQKYIDNVYSTLETGKLGGVDIDNKTQNMLYSGLVQSNYPSMSGKQTNMLGHLLEKYQWVEPRHDLIAEALWLLADPDGYKTSIGNKAEKKTTEKTLRTLKTEQSTKIAGSVADDKADASRVKRNTGITRKGRNFFGRS